NAVSNHAMLLGIHLFAIAKRTSNVISGPTKVLLARDNGIHEISPDDIEQLEEMLTVFNRKVDDLRLVLPNMSIPLAEFNGYVRNFADEVIEMHERLLGRSAQRSFEQALSDPDYRGSPYPKIPLGAVLEAEIDPEEFPKMKVILASAEKEYRRRHPEELKKES